MNSPVTFRTYAAVWTFERRIWKLERVRLPMAVSFRWIGTLMLAIFLVDIPLNQFLLDRFLPWAPVRYVVIPVLLANWLTRAKLDGKPPLAWLVTVASYLVMHKRWALYRQVHPGRQARIHHKAKTRAARG